MKPIHCDICGAIIGEMYDPQIGRKTREHYKEEHPEENQQDHLKHGVH